MSDDELLKALDELCRRGYEMPEEKAKAIALAKRCHALVGAHYPDYRSWFEASAEVNLIENIIGFVAASGVHWDSEPLKSLLRFREERQKRRQLDENR